jgi:hypothetical protein
MRRLGGWLAALVVSVGAVALFGFALAAADVSPAGGSPTRAPIALAPTASPWLRLPGQVQMPAGADCKACHETTGGVIGIKDIPVVPHPVIRWSNCTACHDNARLVQAAPGHSGIHADQCLVCHQQSLGAAPPPAHVTEPNARCLTCHGVTAPLPSDMSHRPSELCWLCHLAPSLAPATPTSPTGSPAPS